MAGSAAGALACKRKYNRLPSVSSCGYLINGNGVRNPLDLNFGVRPAYLLNGGGMANPVQISSLHIGNIGMLIEGNINPTMFTAMEHNIGVLVAGNNIPHSIPIGLGSSGVNISGYGHASVMPISLTA